MGKKKSENKQEHIDGQALLKKMEVDRKKSIVVDKFYPALNSATVSADEAKMLLRSITSLIMGEIMRPMGDRKFSEILPSILEELTKDGERVEEVKALLTVFENENLYTTRELIEGMNASIEQMIIEESQKRTLESFNPDWNRFLYK